MRGRGAVVVLALSLQACGSDDGISTFLLDVCDVSGIAGAPNPSFSAAGVMQASPMPVGAIASIMPLGNLNPPAHVYPTPYLHVVPVDGAAGANNLPAPAAGRVIRLYRPSGVDWKIVVQVDTSFYWFLDHITPFGSVGVGAQVMAGQGVGTNSGHASAVHFGVFNFNNAPLSGIQNACLASSLRYVDSPLKYYSGPVQEALHAKVGVSGGATKDGRIDWDQAGKLVGNWVESGHAPLSAPDKAIAFAYNALNHELRISIGTSLSGGGVYAVQPGAPDFASVTAASGAVNYRLFPTGSGDSGVPGAEFGVLAVQMLTATRIKLELFPGNLTGTATFTVSALIYDR